MGVALLLFVDDVAVGMPLLRFIPASAADPEVVVDVFNNDKDLLTPGLTAMPTEEAEEATVLATE